VIMRRCIKNSLLLIELGTYQVVGITTNSFEAVILAMILLRKQRNARK
jgi:hypothetical protein